MGKVARVLLALAVGALAAIAAPRAAAAAPVFHGGPISGWMATTVPLPANDVAYDATRSQLLVAVQPQHPSLGNELVEIDPVNGALGRRVVVGSDPGRVVVTDDGTMAYVGLRGASEIVRVDLATFTVAARIGTGRHPTWGPRVVEDLEVLPGRNDVVVAALRGVSPNTQSVKAVVAFEDDEPLPVSASGSTRLAATSPSTLHGIDTFGSSLTNTTFTVDASGVTAVSSTGPTGGYFTDIEAALGWVYSTSGHIIDPVTRQQVATFNRPGGLIEVTTDGVLTVVEPANALVSRFDAETGAPIDSRFIGGIPASTSLVATGSGFALASGSAGVTLLGTVVSSAGFVPPAPPANPLPDLQHLALPYRVNDAVFDASRDRLYASVASTSPNRANQVIAVDPTTGSVLASVAVGNDPGPLAMDEGATRLHVGRNGNGRIDAIDLAGFSSLGSFAVGTNGIDPLHAGQIEVRPGTDDELIVSLRRPTGHTDAVALYVDGARRPTSVFGVDRVALAGSSTVWGMRGRGESSDLYELEVSHDGVHFVAQHGHVAGGFDFSLHEGLLYSSWFRIIDPEVPGLAGTLPWNGPVVGDATEPLVYVFAGSNVQAVDQVSLRTVGYYAHGGQAVRSAVSMQTEDSLRFAVVADQLVLVTPRLPGTGTFHSIAPSRLADSRSGHGLPSRLSAGVPQQLQVTGVGGVPATGVSAVVVNLTSVGSNTSSYVTAWPAGLERPRTSNVNFTAGRIVANQAIVPVGAGGRISLVVDQGFTHLVVDVQGWFGDGTDVPGSRLTTLRPARLADSRIANGLPGRLTAGSTRTLQVTGRGGVPATGVTAVVVNLTSVQSTASSYLTAWPTGQARPRTSNVNFPAGQVVANQAIIPVGVGGRINLVVDGGATHVVVDVQGWFGPAGSATGTLLHTTPPARIVDSRVSLGINAQMLYGRGERPVYVAGQGGVPPVGHVVAVVVNLTVVAPTGPSHLTAWPTGLAMPTTSNVNFTRNQVVANQAIIPTGTGGRVSLHSGVDTHLVIDVQGWFAAT